jgi:hypothetical protein
MKRLLAALALVALSTSSAFAALNAYLNLKGQKAGELKGGVTLVSIEPAKTAVARDPASGLPTGKRQHKPLVLTAEVDRASPLAPRMLDDAELQDLVISSTADGKTPVTLQQAKVLSAKTVGDKIMVEIQGITAQDDWEAPVAALRKAAKLDVPAAPVGK